MKLEEIAIAILAGLLGLVLAFATGYLYRAHIDNGAVQAQADKDAQLQETALARALQLQQAKEGVLAQEASANAIALQGEIDATHKALVHEIAAHGADLARLNSCRIPVSDLSMFDAGKFTPSGTNSGATVPGPARAGTPDPPMATIGAGDAIAACDRGHEKFTEAVDKLKSCIASYDACHGAQVTK